MKRFIILSVLVAIAGIAIGVTRRQQPEQAIVAADVTTTTVGAEPATTATTVRAATKAATKTTATTARQVAAPVNAPVVTTSTTRPATTTTTVAVPATTVATVAGPAPTCTLSQENRALRLTSNLPNTPYKMIALYPANPNTMNKIPQQFVRQAITDSAGADLWSPVPSPSPATGPARVSVSFYPAGARSISTLCSTSFEAQ